MASKNTPAIGSQSFEDLKQSNEHDAEYWSARDLQPLLGYSQWRRFEDAINRAITSCEQSGNNSAHHFAGAGKPITGGKGAVQLAQDYQLSRFACSPMQKLGHSSVVLLNPSKAEIKNVDDDTLVTFVGMAAVSEAGFITAHVNKPLKELRKGSYTYFAENDIILAKITPCMENGKCALAKGLENGLGLGSSEFHVVRANPQNVLPEYLFALLNRHGLRETAETVMTGSSGNRRVPATFYANLNVPVPPLADQQKLVAKIENLERDIASAQAVIAAAPAKKQAIMQRHL